MQLNKDFSNINNQIGALNKLKNPAPAAPASPKPQVKTLENQNPNVTYSKSDKNIEKPAAQGNATTTLKDPTDKAISEWKSKASGPKVDFSKMPPSDSKIAVINYLLKDYSAKKLDSSEQKNVQKFFSEIMTKSSKLDDPLKRKEILNIMADGIKTKGLSEAQMDMVASGKFNADAYIGLVNSGEPIG